MNELEINIKNWLHNNSTPKIIWNEHHAKKLINYFKQTTTEEQRAEDDLWMEYILYMNFHYERFKIIESTIETFYSEKKDELILSDNYSDFLFKIAFVCMKQEVFENNMLFEYEDFYSIIENLRKDISRCIDEVVKYMNYEKGYF